MKKERAVQIRVGLFILVSLAVFVYGIFTISGNESLFEREYTVETYFDNAAGLLEGGYVRLSGVGVGSVSSIRFSEDPSLGKVRVVMTISERALSRISEDSVATIKTEGLLGAKFVEILPGSGEGMGRAADGVTIKGYVPPEMQEIITESEALVLNLASISEDLKKIVGELAGEERGGLLHEMIYDEKLADDVGALFSNLALVSESIREGEGTIGALVVDPSVHDALQGVLGEAQRNKFVRSAVRHMIKERKKRISREGEASGGT